MAELNITALKEFIEEKLKDTDGFLVKAEIRPSKEIVVEIDSDTSVDIDFVAALSREIEASFAPEIDDYDLEVGSAGLTSPMLLPRQYVKNIGNDVEVLTKDGKKLHGRLEEADDEGFSIVAVEKVKREGEKRPVQEEVVRRFAYSDVKSVVYDIKF